MRRNRTGFALASLLLLAAVVLVLSLTIAAIGSYHLLMAEDLAAQRSALYLADGIVRLMASRLAATPTYAPSGVVIYPVGSADAQHQAQATFDPTQTQLALSTNNSDGLHGTGYNGSTVPTGAVQILAVGHCGHVTRTVEAVLKVSGFPYAVASDGDAVLPGVDVLAAQSMSEYASSGVASLPGSVGVNGSLAIGPAQVSGDVLYGTGLTDTGTVEVGGAVMQGQIVLPQVSPGTWETSIPPGSTASPTDLGGSVSLDDSHVYRVSPGSGATYTINGNLTLSNAEFFVDGNLVINGSVTGLGAIFVKGNLTINGDARLNAANNAALIVDGDISLSGGGNYFQGLVYSHGGHIQAHRITVVGALLDAAGALGTPPGGITLDNTVKVVFAPEALSLHLQTQPLASNWTATCSVLIGYTCCTPRHHTVIFNPGCGVCLGPQYSDSMPCGLVPHSVQGFDGCVVYQSETQMSKCPAPKYMSTAERTAATTLYNAFQAAMQASPSASAWATITANDAEATFLGTASAGSGNMFVAALHFNTLSNQYEMWQDPLVVCTTGTGMQLESYAQFDTQARAVLDLSADTVRDTLLAAQTTWMAIANGLIQQGIAPPQPPSPPPPYPIDLDLSQFLSNATPLHIVSWRSR